jgi:hypothetical protein
VATVEEASTVRDETTAQTGERLIQNFGEKLSEYTETSE